MQQRLQHHHTKTAEDKPINLRNNGPSIEVPLIFWFLIMTFNICFYPQLWVKWVLYKLEIVLGILDKLINDSRNVCGCLTLNEIHIELAYLIIGPINDNLTNTSSTPPPEVKTTVLYIVNLIILCTSKKIPFLGNLSIKSLTCFKHQINITVVLLFCGSFFLY